MQKAHRLEEIDAAVDKFSPITPDHPFYVDFKDLRGDFQERQVMRILNARKVDGLYRYDAEVNIGNTTLLFLAGMRGSGKTSELAKYAKLLDSQQCFWVITCNIDDELDMDNVQYMDILIFQLEKLLQRADKEELKLDNSIINSLSAWFQERVKEINRSLAVKGSLEMDVGVGGDALSIKGLLGKLLGITVKLKGELTGSHERAESVRETFRSKFVDFSTKFNAFILQASEQLRKEEKAEGILFIVDGLEKTLTAQTRRRIIIEESNRIRQIKANTIFTLPIELMKEEQRIRNFAEIISFPFIKISERDGTWVEEALLQFEEFVRRRINVDLFDSTQTIQEAIKYSGGSPRQLLRIIEQAAWQADPEHGLITGEHMSRAIEKEGNALARYIEPEEFEVLKQIQEELDAGAPIGFDAKIQDLLEKGILFEYNDGTYKRVNPLLEISKLYRHRVRDQL